MLGGLQIPNNHECHTLTLGPASTNPLTDEFFGKVDLIAMGHVDKLMISLKSS